MKRPTPPRSTATAPARASPSLSPASPPTPPSPALRWGVEQRLAFVEERLFWLGEVNRADLVARFGVSMSQASGDIARYLARNPPGVAYDKSAKRYVAGPDFAPVLAPADAGRFLGELRLVELGVLAANDTMLGALPPFAAAPVPQRPVDAVLLRAVLAAIRERHALEALYQSMSRPSPMRRVIEPHALAYDGFRWHARAFDRERQEFRDFVLGRLSKAAAAGPAGSDPREDANWHAIIELVVAPHPKLTPAQARAIALDYGIHRGELRIPVRRALLFYALKRLGLDVTPDARPPHEQHIVLLNRAEVEAALIARGET
ncbi:MAG: WYL domain-containing protein [Methylobacteriaceae bacterium]|nr:WYL domain-containing protein [Methylobacteriaceae bacterium]